jgi:hypothetical protein
MMNTDSPIASCVLVGNSFPLSLVRRKVAIEPVSIGVLQTALEGKSDKSMCGGILHPKLFCDHFVVGHSGGLIALFA